MDTRRVLGLFDAQMRKGITGEAGARVERDGGVVRLVGEDWATVVWADVPEGDEEMAVAAQVAWLDGPQGAGRELEWKHYAHDRPDLADHLTAAGFAAEPPETLMIAEVAALATDVPLPPSVRLETVTDAAGVALMTRVHSAAFGDDGAALGARLLAQLADDPAGVELTVAMVGDEPVCAARMEFHPGTDFAGLWGGGTVPAWRGKGIYRALVAHRARTATARAVRYLQVDALPTSHPILHRLGFTSLTTTTPYLTS